MDDEVYTIPVIAAESRPLGVIYIATNLNNGKKYVGQARDFKRRQRGHLKSIEKYKYYSRFVPALRKHGWDAFTWEVICECYVQQELDSAECFFIKMWKTQDPDFGYNIAPGGVGKTGQFSEIHRKRLSESRKKFLSDPEERRKISERLTSVPHTAERKRNIREAKSKLPYIRRYWMTDRFIERLVAEKDVDAFLKLGWHQGRL